MKIKSINEWKDSQVNEAKNIKGKIIGSIGDFQVFPDKELGHKIILIVQSGKNQYEYPIKVNPDKIDNLKVKYYKGKDITIPNTFTNEAAKPKNSAKFKDLDGTDYEDGETITYDHLAKGDVDDNSPELKRLQDLAKKDSKKLQDMGIDHVLVLDSDASFPYIDLEDMKPNRGKEKGIFVKGK